MRVRRSLFVGRRNLAQTGSSITGEIYHHVRVQDITFARFSGFS